MNNKILKLIESNLKKELHFVFPSEISARSTMKFFLENTDVEVLESSRFISWDNFKKDSQIFDKEKRPINNLALRFFAEDLVQRTKEEASFIPYFYDQNNSFSNKVIVENIVKILSKINLVNSLKKAVMPQAFYLGIEIIKSEYEEFLTKNNFYDPNLEKIEDLYKFKDAIIFYPELILDFQEYKALEEIRNMTLVSASGRIESGKIKHEEILNVHASVPGEVANTLEQIRVLLDSGVNPEEIIITSCGADEYLSYLHEFSQEYGISLIFRKGKNLSEYEAGEFFQSIASICSRDFLFEQVKALLLNPVFPLKNKSQYVEFLQEASRACFIAGEKDLLALARKKELVQEFFRASKSLYNVTSFSKLVEQIDGFLKEFTLVEYIDRENIRPVFERTLEILRELRNLEKDLSDLKVSNYYEFFLETLASTIYVPQEKSNGINVYNYRVTAGAKPKHHFILGFSQSASEVKKDALSFVPEIIRSKEFEKDYGFEDFSNDFFKNYLLSGDKLYFSMAEETNSGTMLLPQWFSSKTSFENIKDFTIPLVHEKNFWNGKASDFLLTSKKLESFDKHNKIKLAEEIASFKPLDLEEEAQFLFEDYQGEKKIKLSATNLDALQNCPFRFYFSRILKSEKEYPQTQFTNFLLEGTILHKAAEYYVEELDKGNCMVGAEELVDRALEKYEFFFYKDVRKEAFKINAYDYMESFIEKFKELSTKVFKDEKLEIATEKSFKLYIDDFSLSNVGEEEEHEALDVILEGKIDRLETSGNRAIIYDYKSGKVDIKESNFLPDLEELGKKSTSSYLQLPFYSFLYEQANKEDKKIIVATPYYSFKNKDYKIAFIETQHMKLDINDKTKSIRHKKEVYKDLILYIIQAKKIIDAKNFGIKENVVCTYCSFKQICRKDYRVKE